MNLLQLCGPNGKGFILFGSTDRFNKNRVLSIDLICVNWLSYKPITPVFVKEAK